MKKMLVKNGKNDLILHDGISPGPEEYVFLENNITLESSVLVTKQIYK